MWHFATKHFGPASFRIRNLLLVVTGKVPGMSFLTIFGAIFFVEVAKSYFVFSLCFSFLCYGTY